MAEIAVPNKTHNKLVKIKLIELAPLVGPSLDGVDFGLVLAATDAASEEEPVCETELVCVAETETE